VGYLGDQPTFDLCNGWFTLRAAEPDNSSTPKQSYQVPVGHALGQMLREGDIFKIWLYSNACWTYWLVRDEIFRIGVGHFSGKLGQDIEVVWQPHGTVRPTKVADYSHAAIRLAGQTFELKENEEVISGPYYAKCLHLGSTMILGGGQKPQIAMIMTEEPSIRDAFVAFFALNDKMRDALTEMTCKIRSLSDDVQNGKRPREEFMSARAQIFKELDAQIQKLYEDSGMPQPKTKL